LRYTYDNIFRVLASGTTSGGWNHSTAIELTNFNIQHHLCEESQQGALFIPNCGQSLIWNGWIEHCTYPGNLTLGQWNIHSLSMETNTNPLYMSQSRFMNYLFSNPTGKGIDADTQMTVAYDTGEYTSRSVSTYEKGFGEWNTHGLYLNSPVRFDFNATQKYVSNITSSAIWVYVGHFFLPTLAQTMNIRVSGRTGYSTASALAGIDGSAVISIQNRGSTASTVSWHSPRNGCIHDVVYTQPYERDTHIYVKIPAYSRVGFFVETNGLLRKDTGTPTYIQWDMSTVADISELTTQDAVSTCSMGTTSAGLIADGENNLLYLYSAADTVGELDVLKLGVNDKIKSLPLMSGGAWKLPVYYFEDLPDAASNWWSICICRAFIGADSVVYKTQVVHSDGTYWRPQQNPSTYIIGSA
jgi:amylovoran biosynthesis protein AmsF